MLSCLCFPWRQIEKSWHSKKFKFFASGFSSAVTVLANRETFRLALFASFFESAVLANSGTLSFFASFFESAVLAIAEPLHLPSSLSLPWEAGYFGSRAREPLHTLHVLSLLCWQIQETLHSLQQYHHMMPCGHGACGIERCGVKKKGMTPVLVCRVSKL
jgi:hypothetical protein